MKKYKVTQEFIDELEEWQNKWENGLVSLNEFLFDEKIKNVERWRFTYFSKAERNQRFGAIINWINGEDVFEIGTPKYIVQRRGFNLLVGNEYLSIDNYSAIHFTRDKDKATRFDDFEKASGWANAHLEVVEVDE